MNKNHLPKFLSSEITPKSAYLTRREFVRAAAGLLGSALLAACTSTSLSPETQTATPTVTPTDKPEYLDEQGDPATPFDKVTVYNNYYEFSTAKAAVAPLSKDFSTSPWEVKISGLVQHPRVLTLDDLVRLFPPEERVYRLRCVEGWSMVIPWLGLPLAKLIASAEPLSDGKFVRFVTLHDPDRFLRQRDPAYPWPYQEGLRMDEAMNELTFLATGLYSGELPAQNGGGLRLVVPWKYGFKSSKAIVEIEIVKERPQTFWNTIAPHEYGFYANVNPNVDHPRWSQSTERRIGEFERRETLLFNGYAEQVAGLYTGMDLSGLF